MKILRKTLHIGGMSCVNCEHRIRYVLKTAPGIQDATVSYNTGLAHVTYDTDTISLKQIREIIEKNGYTTPADNTLQRMVDREAKRAEGKGVGYDRWAAKHNLKQMAATVTAYQQYGFSSPEELDEACSAAYAAMQESLAWLKQVEKTLNGKKELQRQVLAYSKTRPVRDGLKQQKNAKAKAAYRQKYESDFIIADAAARYFRENGISKLPSYKALQAEIETLIQEKNSGYNDYRAKREEYRRLQTVKGNIDQILHRERKPVKRQEQER